LASAAAAILTAFCILGWGIAPADPAAASSRADAAVLYHECGHLERFIGVVAHDLSCRKALTVARAFLAGNHHPLGFRCKRVNVNAAAGYFTHCIKRSAALNVIPE
jgi:hypothetical protein